MAMAMVVMLIASSKAILVMLMASSMAIFTFFQLVFCSEALGTARHLIQYSHLACYIFSCPDESLRQLYTYPSDSLTD